MNQIDFRKLIINQNYCTQIPFQELENYRLVKHKNKFYRSSILMDYYNNFLKIIESKSIKPLSPIQFIVKSTTGLDLIQPDNKIFPIIYKNQIIGQI